MFKEKQHYVKIDKKEGTDVRHIGFKRIAWDCPHCSYCLHIHQDSKGNVVDVTRAEQKIQTETQKLTATLEKAKEIVKSSKILSEEEIEKIHNKLLKEAMLKPLPSFEERERWEEERFRKKDIKFLAETILEQQKGQLCPQTIKTLKEMSK